MSFFLYWGGQVLPQGGGLSFEGSADAPPTKEGKNNGYHQTNARTVNIIKYINFFDGPVFMAQKYLSKHLKQTPRQVVFFSIFFGKNGSK